MKPIICTHPVRPVIPQFRTAIAASRGPERAIRTALSSLLGFLTIAAPAVTDFVRLPDLPHVASNSWSPAWGDYDGDGDIDLAVANGAGTSTAQRIDLYRNRGDGTFERQTVAQAGAVVSELGSWGVVTWADMDNDGRLDLIAAATTWAGGVFHPPCLFRNQGDGSFRSVAAGGFSAATSGLWPMPPADLDGDGYVDILATGDSASPSHFLFWNRGDGSMARDRVAPITTDGLLPNFDFWADVDDDGDLDVFVPNLSPTASLRDRLYLNDGRGQFTPVTDIPLVNHGGVTYHGAFGDYDQDGDFDCVLIKDGPPRFFRNDGGTFVSADIGLPSTAGGALWVDFDNDGFLDLDIERGQGGSTTNSLLRNLGNGTFESVVNLLTTNRVSRQGSAWGDLDNDGFLDLAEVSPQGGARLYRNLGNGNHWLKLRLKGVAANAAGLGALVRVRATIGGQSVLQTQHVGGGGPGQQDIRPHFGLGDAAQADEVFIRWPSGNVQVLTNVAANQILAVTEVVRIDPPRPAVTIGGSQRLYASGQALGQQWYFEGAPLEGGIGSTLSLTNLQPSQAGRYTVVANTADGLVTNSVFLRVDARFTKILAGDIVTEKYASWAANWFDYDRDGKLDLLVNNNYQGPRDSLFHNDGNGAFTRVTVGPVPTLNTGSYAVAVADYDNNGWVDLFTGRLSGRQILRGDGQGGFLKVVAFPENPGFLSNSGAWADYDLDGDLDLYLANGGNSSTPQMNNDELYRNLGDGSFSRLTAAQQGDLLTDRDQTWCGVWFDYDVDGAPDLLVHHDSLRPRLHHNNGDGTFTQVQAGSLSTQGPNWAGAVGDYDNDGRLDVITTSHNGPRVTLHRNLGNGIFEDVSAAVGIAKTGLGEWPLATWTDYDNDGHLDFFVASYSACFLYRNRGDGTFQSADLTNLRNGGINQVMGAWGDYDNNGFPDLLVVCGDAAPQLNHLYRNNGNGNHWLKVKLVGTTSNRSGIGAKVRVRAAIGGRTFWQMREIAGNSAWSGAQQLVAEFGLGNATRAITVRVEWPSGIVQQVGLVAADQMLELVEPPRWTLSARRVAEGVRVEIRGPANAGASVQWATDLSDWRRLEQGSVTTDATGAAVVTVPVGETAGTQFFRVVVP